MFPRSCPTPWWREGRPRDHFSLSDCGDLCMSNSAANAGDIFDVRRIRRLVELMNEHELGEIDLRDGPLRIRLRKHQDQVLTTLEPRAPLAVAAAPAPSAAPPPSGSSKNDEHLVVI